MITVIGSINLDLTATTARLPVPGETVLGEDFTTAPGGKGANQALAVLRSGGRLRLAGAVGDDGFAEQALAELRREGADLSLVATVPGATGIAVILVGGKGENVIVVVPGANARVGPDEAMAAIGAAPNGGHVLLQQEIPGRTIRTALNAARERGSVSILNIAPVIPATAELAELADIVIANQTEFGALWHGDASVEDAALAWAREMGKTLVLTLGADGALAATPDGVIRAPALPVTPVDTVGAGDTFCGYFAAGLDAGLSLPDALARAAAAGSLACLKVGAQPAIPYASEVDGAPR